MDNIEVREQERLLHAALDVAVPLDRYQYLRGYIEGYKARDEQCKIGFKLSSGKEKED